MSLTFNKVGEVEKVSMQLALQLAVQLGHAKNDFIGFSITKSQAEDIKRQRQSEFRVREQTDLVDL